MNLHKFVYKSSRCTEAWLSIRKSRVKALHRDVSTPRPQYFTSARKRRRRSVSRPAAGASVENLQLQKLVWALETKGRTSPLGVRVAVDFSLSFLSDVSSFSISPRFSVLLPRPANFRWQRNRIPLPRKNVFPPRLGVNFEHVESVIITYPARVCNILIFWYLGNYRQFK